MELARKTHEELRVPSTPQLTTSGAIAVLPQALADCAHTARSILRARSKRADLFDPRLFSDPAWDILLELFVAEADHRRLQVSAIGLAAGIPLTTTLRWLNSLSERGLIERTPDVTDARRFFIQLSEEGVLSMILCLREYRSARDDERAQQY
jgi:DNA-binding MarR family transcriptional regulator